MSGVDYLTQELSLGKAIAKARHHAGLTQQELCVRAKLSYSTLAKIERGAIKTPSVFTVAAIAEATGTSVESLAGIDTSKTQKAAQKVYKAAKNGIKFVYFDVNGVLVRFYQRAFSDIALITGASTDLIESVFWHYNDELCRGDMTVAQFDAILAKRIGSNQISWAKFYLANVEPVIEMQSLILWVAEYYYVGLMTNSMPGMLKAMTAANLLPPINYDAVIDSSTIGMIKPETGIFELGLKLSKVRPNELLLIDDNNANVMAAEKMGWHVIWFDAYRPKDGEARIRQMLEFAP